MSRYILIRRLRGPAILLLIGILALLHQAGVIDHFWHLFWPLLLIMIGLFMLAERASITAEEGYPPAWPGAPYSGVAAPPAPGAPQYPQPPTTAIVPAHGQDFGNNKEGGQS
ncbi:MAG: DUF5668 domain-containing protein [Terracidiphilus sp.]|nr:DUF5668 domain-containing protein [Terracidiphilus sp.]